MNNHKSDITHFSKITVSGDNIPKPIASFENSSFPKYIKEHLSQQQFEKPSPIQAQVYFNTMR